MENSSSEALRVVRKATPDDAPGIARVHIAVQGEIYRGVFPDALFDNVSVEAVVVDKRRKVLEDVDGKSCTFVAEDGNGSIFGYATGGPRREGPAEYDGELYNIFVLEAYQRQGWGSALWLSVVDFLQVNGNRSLLLWVLKDTGAVSYYERLNGKKVAEREGRVAGISVVLLCYGWERLDRLSALLALASASYTELHRGNTEIHGEIKEKL